MFEAIGGSVVSNLIGGVGVAIVVALATVIGRWYKTHQDNTRNTRSLSEFFFDTPANPDTGVPMKKGWTTKIEGRVSTLEKKEPDDG